MFVTTLTIDFWHPIVIIIITTYLEILQFVKMLLKLQHYPIFIQLILKFYNL